jgi:prevent-host-death family protein
MTEIGIRQLKQQASDIVRRVSEGKEVITITNRGHAVARLVPVEDLEVRRVQSDSVWAEMDELAQKIGASWPEEISAVEAVKEQRRVL